MKLSNLIRELFNKSEFTSPGSLAVHTNQTHPFVDAFINGSKASREKEDLLFEELTKGITADELLAAIELIKVVRLNEIERNQFL
ncbi:hypothetical protein [Maribacter sp.]|uniref:hypothetical protein n=1 Tax=Maribacter sp. TaxID=1897614 RepID=UPI0025C295BC|nr:hypothetical protein [Maribacter sp.]